MEFLKHFRLKYLVLSVIALAIAHIVLGSASPRPIADAVAEGRYDAGVLIHEGRFVYERYDLELVADLGIEWERKTSLPLPLGSIVAKRELDDEVIACVERVLRRSIEYAFANPMTSRDYVKQHAQELDDKVIDSHIALFVNDYSLSLGDEGRKAVEKLIGVNL